MLTPNLTQEPTTQSDPARFYEEVLSIADSAYDHVAGSRLDRATIHQLPFCHEVSSFMVQQLVDRGYQADHKLKAGLDTGEHSYSVVNMGDREVLIESAWQQFLPRHLLTSSLPKVLVGPRTSIIGQVRAFGVPQTKLDVWHEAGARSAADQRLQDASAEAAAEEAAEAGKWEKFLAGTK